MRYLTSRAAKYRGIIGGSAAIALLALHVANSAPPSGQPALPSGPDSNAAAPIYGVKIPTGYRDWQLVSVGHETGKFNELRAQLGNDVAIKAYREGKLPFPDGTVIVALHWKYVPSDENNKALGQIQSFVPGPATNMQFMVKDSKRYAATGGWGFADFTGDKPAGKDVHERCFPCHQAAEATDFVFARYSTH